MSMSSRGGKRKKDKSSPDISENSVKRSTTMAQNGGQIVQSGQYAQQYPQTWENQVLAATPTPQHVGQSPIHYGSQASYMNLLSSPVFSPCPPASQTQPSVDIFKILMQRLEAMDSKLTQMQTAQTGIQNSMTSLTVQINGLDAKISTLDTRVGDIEKSRQFDSQILDEISTKQKNIEAEFKKIKEAQITTSNESLLKDEIIDLKCRSMRDNLLFHKIPEERDENCVDKILNFIENEMKIENGKNDKKIQRAHRVGRYNASKVRPIVAKFAFFPDRERVRKAASNLRGKPFGISEQFPREIMETRRKLVPIMKKARDDGKEAILKVDKLYIDKRLYTGPV